MGASFKWTLGPLLTTRYPDNSTTQQPPYSKKNLPKIPPDTVGFLRCENPSAFPWLFDHFGCHFTDLVEVFKSFAILFVIYVLMYVYRACSCQEFRFQIRQKLAKRFQLRFPFNFSWTGGGRYFTLMWYYTARSAVLIAFHWMFQMSSHLPPSLSSLAIAIKSVHLALVTFLRSERARARAWSLKVEQAAASSQKTIFILEDVGDLL